MDRFCRLVGYFYVFGHGGRRECCGCVKMLLRGEKLRILLQFTKNGQEGEAGLWLLLRDAEGGTGAYRLDRIQLRNGVREYCLTYCTGKLPAPGGRPEGVLLTTGAGHFYGAVMEGCHGGREDMFTWCRRVPKDMWRQKRYIGTEDLECRDESVCEALAESVTEALAESVGDVVGLENDYNKTPETVCEMSAQNRKDSMWEKKNDPLTEALEKQERMAREEALRESELTILPLWEKATELMKRRPAMNPFVHSPFARCARISLCDVHLLYRDTDRCAGNSFLCHGYYRYRHLLLAATCETKEKPATFYLLVPGMNSALEQRTGEMHGFHRFYGLRRSAWENQSFGYYAMELVTKDREW